MMTRAMTRTVHINRCAAPAPSRWTSASRTVSTSSWHTARRTAQVSLRLVLDKCWLTCQHAQHPFILCACVWQEMDHGLLIGNHGAIAAGVMLSWEGHGTKLPPGFAALRLQTCWITLRAMEQLPHAGRGDGGRCMSSPAHLLCRALRMAPLNYRRFELAAPYQPPSILVRGAQTSHVGHRAWFDSATDLAAAMQRFAPAENLIVELSADQDSIIVHRLGSERLLAAAEL